jgi:prolyl oligopeptidase
MVKSHDGVDVPVSIVYRRDVERNGEAPLLLDAYGAYGISQEPYYSPSLLAWLERGGVFAVAHVRGGGEFGKAWHDAGRLANKPNTLLDVIAAADALVRERWTSPAHLGIIGGSAGGIAVGGALVTRPELFRAVVSQVGVHDLLRSELTSNGPSNIPEFGTVTTEEGFRMLYAMSSYHHVKDGVAYPAALFTTGFNDPRVDSWQPAKMAARLQAVNGAKDGSGRPVLLRVDFAGGHGIGSTKQQAVEETADVFAFLLWQLGGGN